MTHLTELQCSMLADGALLAPEKAVLLGHLNNCSRCQERVDNLQQESVFIAQVLEQEEVIFIPAFKQPATLLEIIKGLGGISLIAWALLSLWQLLWQSKLAEFFSEIFSWVGSFHLADGLGLTVTTVLYFSQEGNTMIDTLFVYVLLGLVFSGFIGFMLSRREFRGVVSLCLAVLLFSGIASSPPAEALEIRTGEDTQTIEASETIDDTLVVAGETSIINGTINGDLIVFGKRVIVNGTVSGNLIVFTESVTISGRIDGSVMGFANLLEMANADIGSNLWSFSNRISVNGDSKITGNATVFTNTASIAGDIGRDLTGFGQSIEMSGRVEGDVESFSQNVNLIGDAYIGGDLRFHSRDENSLQQSSSAVVAGTVEHILDKTRVRGNKFLNSGFYIWLALRLVMGFLSGILLLWLFPSLRRINLSGGVDDLKTAGLGLLGLIFIPILMVIAAITVVGLPFTLVGAVVWTLGLLFAKVIVASIIGRMIVSAPEKRDNYILTLFAGLMVVTLLVSIPMLGGILGFIMTILGFGILLQQGLSYLGIINSAKS